MSERVNASEIYLEVGQSRTFAVALDWPGWCRSGRDESAALQALVDYSPRYARAIEATGLLFRPPADVSALKIVDRLQGDATTDFGAPSISLTRDAQPIGPGEPERWRALLLACWDALDAAVQMASGRELKKGPRGGRDLAKIVNHIVEVDAAYLSSLGGKIRLGDDDKSSEGLVHVRETILTTLDAAVRGEIPARGPRGGVRWTPRYFVRRLAWHELDHAWEIEDRIE